MSALRFTCGSQEDPAMPLGAQGTLKQKVVASLGYEIVSGQLEPSTVLQLEQLAAAHGVSLPVVREAVSALALLGLVESRRRRGTIVLGPQHWSHASPDVITWKLQDPTQRKEQFRWLIEMRAALEPAAAELAAHRRSTPAAHRLCDLAEALREAADKGDLDEFLRVDIEFHELLFRESENPLIAGMARQMDVVLAARHHYDLMPPRPDMSAVQYHIQLAKAIMRQSPEEARLSNALIVEQATKEFLQRLDDE